MSTPEQTETLIARVRKGWFTGPEKEAHEEAVDELAACLAAAETALATYEAAVQKALAIAPKHWQRYRDPLELGPDIRAARRIGRAALSRAEET